MSRLLTLGGRAEVGPSLVNAGGTAGLATGAGNIEAGAAASRAASAGGAGYLGWKAQLGRRVSAAAQLRAMSARYATVSLDRLADRSLLRAVVGISISPTPRVSLLGELSAFRDRDAGQGWRGTLRTVLGVGRAQQVGASLSAASWSGRQVAWEAMVTWSVQLPRSHSLQLGAGADDGSGSGWASVTRGLGTGPGIGYRVEAGAGPGAVASVDVQGQSRFGWAAVRGRWVDPWTARRSQSGELEVATRLTLIDGGVYASRPADGGYALVVLDGAPGVHVTLDGQEVGRTDRNGRLLVPGLLPYYGNRIAIRDPDVPLGYRVDEVSRHVAPRFQGGTVERFEVGPPRVATGKVLLSTGEDQGEEVPAWGEIAVEQPSGPVVSPIGDDGMFWLEGLPPGRQEALVRWRGRSCGVTLEIPASAGVAQLGVLRCAPGPEAEDAPAPGSP